MAFSKWSTLQCSTVSGSADSLICSKIELLIIGFVFLLLRKVSNDFSCRGSYFTWELTLSFWMPQQPFFVACFLREQVGTLSALVNPLGLILSRRLSSIHCTLCRHSPAWSSFRWAEPKICSLSWMNIFLRLELTNAGSLGVKVSFLLCASLEQKQTVGVLYSKTKCVLSKA